MGVSRQHVVDMCDRGLLPHVRVGTHRRIPEYAVSEILNEVGQQPDSVKLSVWLHAALIPHILRDSDSVVQKAHANIANMRSRGAGDRSERYLKEWEGIIESGAGSMIDTFLDNSDHAVTLRSCTPFAGVLSPVEVNAIKSEWRKFRNRAYKP